MKVSEILVSLVLLTSALLPNAYAGTDECNDKAIEAAAALYTLNAGVIQGSSPDFEVISTRTLDHGMVRVNVQISDSNEDGDSWTVKVAVKLHRKGCHIRSIAESSVDSDE